MAAYDNDPDNVPRQILSVADYTRTIKDVLEENVPASWVRGEVSNLRKQSSGHIYFTLKDDRSQLSCVLFRGDAMRQKLLPREGEQIVVYGRVGVYEPRGTYQLIVRQVVADGVGALQARFEELKRRLDAEGLFAADSKRSLPLVPLAIAVVTSPTGAAVRDFISILKRRGWQGRIVVVAAKVQGEDAAADIVAGLDWIEANREQFDLVVVTRGGGSLEDLWPFNEEAVVRAIARRSLPLISAVGHEIDFTLSDFAADVRAETPSGAAELISSLHLEFRETLSEFRRQLGTAIDSRMERLRDKTARLQLHLKSLSPARRLESLNLRLDDLAERLSERVSRQFALHDKRFESLRSRLSLCSPQARIQLLQTRIIHLDERIQRTTTQAMVRHHELLRTVAHRLENSSIRKTLQRGFALTRRPDGTLVTKAAELTAGDPVRLEYADASRDATITNS